MTQVLISYQELVKSTHASMDDFTGHEQKEGLAVLAQQILLVGFYYVASIIWCHKTEKLKNKEEN